MESFEERKQKYISISRELVNKLVNNEDENAKLLGKLLSNPINEEVLNYAENYLVYTKDFLLLSLIYKNHFGKFIKENDNIAVKYCIAVLNELKNNENADQYKIFIECCKLFGYGNDSAKYQADHYLGYIALASDSNYSQLCHHYIMKEMGLSLYITSHFIKYNNLFAKVNFIPHPLIKVDEKSFYAEAETGKINEFEDFVIAFHELTDPVNCLDGNNYLNCKAGYEDIKKSQNYHEIDYILERIQKSKGIRLK